MSPPPILVGCQIPIGSLCRSRTSHWIGAVTLGAPREICEGRIDDRGLQQKITAHADKTQRQHPLASDAVSKMSEHYGADRTGEETRREGRE